MSAETKTKHLCKRCRQKIPTGCRYTTRLVSYSAYDPIDLDLYQTDLDLKKAVQRLTSSIRKNKTEKQLLNEICIGLEFDLCRNCRDRFLKELRSFIS